MLRGAAALLLHRSSIAQAAAAASPALLQSCSSSSSNSGSSSGSGGGGGNSNHQQIQCRSISNTPMEAGADIASSSSGLSAADIIAHADQLVDVSSAASDAVVLAAKAGCWTGTRYFIDLLMWTHDSLHMPWFEAIMVSNLVVKLAFLPLAVMTQKQAPIAARIRAETERCQELSRKASQARSAAEYELVMQEFHAAMAATRARSKKKIMTTLGLPLLNVAQICLFVSQFSAVQVLAKEKLPAMTHEGAAWFANLTVPDPFYALGVIAAAATLGMIRSPAIAESMAQMQGDAGNIMKKVMYFSALVMIPLCAFTPSAVALLWTSNAVLQMGQALLLANPGVRLMLGLPTKQTPVTAPNFLNSFTAMMQPTKDAATAAAPPPGTKPGLVVNYLPHKPRVRKRRA